MNFNFYRPLLALGIAVFSMTSLPTGLAAESAKEASSKKKEVWLSGEERLFPILKADPRQVRFALGHRWHDQAYRSGSVADVSVGDFISIWKADEYKCFTDGIQAGVEAGAWAVFNLSSTEFDLLNTDWYAGLPVYAQMGPWAFRARLYHISSHLGDEYIISNGLTTRKNPSFEAIDLTACYSYSDRVKSYASIGRVLHYHSSFPIHRLYGEIGGEFFGSHHVFKEKHLVAQPYAAIHVRLWEMHNFEPTVNYVAGFLWGDSENPVRRLSTSIQYFNGHSLEGEFSRLRSDYVSFAIGYDY